MSQPSRTVTPVSTQVFVTPYGVDASRELAAAIERAKGASPLAPVTVIVSSNFAGLAARRRLGGTSGVVNTHFVTAFRLAELLAADLLLDRRPLTNPVLGAAVRLALEEDPGPFRDVRDHVATESALAALYAELSNLTPQGMQQLQERGAAAAAPALALHGRIAAHLQGFHDESDLATAAAERGDLAHALEPFGAVIWYLPAPTTAPLARFVGSVLHAAPSTVIVGVTGDDQADGAVWGTCARAGVAPPSSVAPGEGMSVEPVTADQVISVTDADEEVRAVVRRIVELMAEGVALDRIGVFHPVPDPYVGILEQQLAAAGIPANGPSRRRLVDTVAGRTLLAALQLPSQRWRRDRVMALVNGAPVRHEGSPVHPGAWETLSREVGVVQDLADWTRKVDERRRALQDSISELQSTHGDAAAGRIAHLERACGDLEQMAAFVSGLAHAVGAVERADGWSAASTAATALLHSLLGPGHRHSGWPEEEQVAFERIEDALTRLATLDELEPRPSHQVFVRALVQELDVTVGRNGRFGDGVMYGPLAAAVGHDLDAVFVLGCAEGLCPARRRDDSMLPDAVRELAGGELGLRRDAIHEQHRWFLAALAAAPAGRRVLTFPRGNLRGSRESLPSRWLLDTASALAERRVHTTDFEQLEHPMVHVVPSHVAGLRSSAVHGSLMERDLAVVAAHVAIGGEAIEHPAAAPVRRGLRAQVERRSERFTEWDGNLIGQPLPSTDDRPLSATRLETWAKCGFRYFLGQVLGLGDRDDPERVAELSALDRGSGVHLALERFYEEVIESGVPDPDQPWTPEQHERLRVIADEVLADYERRGRAGRPVSWKLTRGDVLAMLDEFLHADDAFRSATGMRPDRVELPFGMDGAEPVTLELPGGRKLSFRGKADRVDVGDDGRVAVTDYKTGKGTGYEALEDDPVTGGTTLQLGLYAEAARQQLGADQVDSHYWMVNVEAGFRRVGYSWTEDRRERFIEVVTAIVDGVEGGMFAAVPGDWNHFRGTNDNCAYCEFDPICPRDRGEHAEAKLGAPELQARKPLRGEGSQ